MSQYPSPYQPPQPYPYGTSYGPPPDPGTYARNAGVLMMVLGVLMAAFGGCAVAGGFTLEDRSAMSAEQRSEIDRAEERLKADLGIDVLTFAKIVGGIIAVPAFGMVFLGLYIRRGNTVAIILGIIASGGCAIMLGLMAVLSLPAGNIFAGCVMIVPLGLFCLEVFWLAKAVMSAGPLKVFNEQQQAYQWQMAQHARAQQEYYQQMYQQQGFNYPSAPPPPPPQGPAKNHDEPPPT